MTHAQSRVNLDFVTVIHPVLEVTLVGKVQAHLWQPLLDGEAVTIRQTQGEADVLISAVDARYYGIRFRELSVSIGVGEPGDNRYFLVQAYNSLRVFAWVEQRWFRTPYAPATMTVSPEHITLKQGQTEVFSASRPAASPVLQSGYECRDVRLDLPRRLRQHPSQPHYFFARLEGDTQYYAGTDTRLTLRSGGHDPVFAALEAARLRIEAWSVRLTARHSKSRTVDELPAR